MKHKERTLNAVDFRTSVTVMANATQTTGKVTILLQKYLHTTIGLKQLSEAIVTPDEHTRVVLELKTKVENNVSMVSTTHKHIIYFITVLRHIV